MCETSFLPLRRATPVLPRPCGLWGLLLFVLLLILPAASGLAQTASERSRRPDILLITVDTLRSDRLSSYGYERQTSPHIDRLIARGTRFTEARTPVALTCPALASVMTTLYPQEHGSTRNGLSIRPDLPSFPKLLHRVGYRTGAIISNWTLRDELCGLAEHFDDWMEVLTRRRLIFARREAHAGDVTDEAVDWLEERLEEREENTGRTPFFLWVHYVEPHFPYQLHEEFLDQLDLGMGSAFSANHRYDTEIAYVDHHIGRLLTRLTELQSGAGEDPDDTLIVFTADHGESLGHHGGYWGHGKHVYEAGLHIPLAVIWPSQVEAGGVIEFFRGFDWSTVMRGEVPSPMDRVTYHQGHRGAVKPTEEQVALRQRGLLEVGLVRNLQKEVFVVRRKDHKIFDLVKDRVELVNLVDEATPISDELMAWLEEVEAGLVRSDDLPPPRIDAENYEQLKALGYVD